MPTLPARIRRFKTRLTGNNITAWQADAFWQPQQWLRLGLGYRYLDARLNTCLGLTGSSSRIATSLRAHGPQLTLEALYWPFSQIRPSWAVDLSARRHFQN